MPLPPWSAINDPKRSGVASKSKSEVYRHIREICLNIGGLFS